MGIWSVDESKELITVDMKLHVEWQEQRLNLSNIQMSRQSPIVLKPQFLKQLWHPEIYIERVQSIIQDSILSQPASVKIFPDNVVRYSTRFTVTTSCQMDFRYYPVDTQKCDFSIENFSYNDGQMVLQWKEKGILMERVELANYYVKLNSFEEFTVKSPLSGTTYSRIRFTVELKRKWSYHILQTYLPSTIFILVSWLSFILPYDSTTERMGYSMSCLFTITAMFGAVRQSTPNVSYIKALDIWMVTCIFFIFLTLIQHAVICKMRRCVKLRKYVHENKHKLSSKRNARPKTKRQKLAKRFELETSFSRNIIIANDRSVVQLNKDHSEEETENSNNSCLSESDEKNGCPLTAFQSVMKITDKYLSFIIPFLFLIFNAIYWIWLINIIYSDDST